MKENVIVMTMMIAIKQSNTIPMWLHSNDEYPFLQKSIRTLTALYDRFHHMTIFERRCARNEEKTRSGTWKKKWAKLLKNEFLPVVEMNEEIKIRRLGKLKRADPWPRRKKQ